MFSSEKKQDIISRKSITLLLADAYLKWSTIVLITITHFKMILGDHLKNEVPVKEMHSALPFFSNTTNFSFISFLAKFVVIRKKE